MWIMKVIHWTRAERARSQRFKRVSKLDRVKRTQFYNVRAGARHILRVTAHLKSKCDNVPVVFHFSSISLFRSFQKRDDNSKIAQSLCPRFSTKKCLQSSTQWTHKCSSDLFTEVIPPTSFNHKKVPPPAVKSRKLIFNFKWSVPVSTRIWKGCVNVSELIRTLLSPLLKRTSTGDFEFFQTIPCTSLSHLNVDIFHPLFKEKTSHLL